MKKIFAALIVLALCLGTLACVTPPEKPTCPVGTIEVSPAVWHEPVPGDCPTLTFSDSRQVVDVDGHYIYADKVNEPIWVPTTYKMVCPAEPYTSTTVKDCRSQHKSGSPSVYHYADKVQVVDVAGHFVDNYVCPAGFSSHGQDCRKWIDTTYKTETFGPIDVHYGKSSDPNHCHRPAGESLGVPSWAMSDFNKLPELLDPAKGTDGYWTGPECRPPVVGTVIDVDCKGVFSITTTEGVPGPRVDLFKWVDPSKLETVTVGDAVYNEPSKCYVAPPPPVCVDVPQYYQFTLVGPDGQIGYMISWDQKPDGSYYLPNTDRQECVLGYTAKSAPFGDYVTKNSCTGEIKYGGISWGFFKPKMVTPHWSGQCAMGGC